MTHSENLGTLKEKEAAGAYLSGDFGDPNGYGGMYNCMDYQENFNNDPVNIAGGPEFRVENVEGEGTFVQLFDETFGGWFLANPSTTGDMGIPYTFNPLAQAQANPYRFEEWDRSKLCGVRNPVVKGGSYLEIGSL